MKLNLLSTIALGAILVLAAARPASAEPLFTGATWDDITTCQSSTVYPYDELRACERAMDDLSAQAKTTTIKSTSKTLVWKWRMSASSAATCASGSASMERKPVLRRPLAPANDPK